MLQQPTTVQTASPVSEPLQRWRAVPVATWVAQVAVAVILAQTLFFKLSYAPETQVIFGERGGRAAATLVGIVELVCAILLLIPRTAALGALLSLLVISGALFTHLTALGISIPVAPGSEERDGGLLFLLAVVVALGSIVVLVGRRNDLTQLARRFRSA